MKKKNGASVQTGNKKKYKNIVPNPQVYLNNQEAVVSSLFKQNGTINQFIASSAGVMRLAARICDLKEKGAVIESVKKDHVHDGVLHPNCSFYTLVGWEG